MEQKLQGFNSEIQGRKANELTKEQKEKLKKILNEKDSWTKKEVQKFQKKNWSEVPIIPRKKDSKIICIKQAKPYRRTTGNR